MRYPQRAFVVSLGLLLSLLLVDHPTRAFAPASTTNPRRQSAAALLLFQTSSSSSSSDFYDDENDNNNSNTMFSMASLQKRMNQVSQNDNILPLVVLDAMLPRQVLKISVQNDLLKKLVLTRIQAETPYFGMLGLGKLATGERVHLQHGVKVEIVGQPRVVDVQKGDDENDEEDGPSQLQLELKAVERFHLEPETVENAAGGWTQARVTFADSAAEEAAEREQQPNGAAADPMSLARAMDMAREFTNPNVSMGESKSLVDIWIDLARQKERQPGQMDQLLADLGPIPSWEEPSECAFWVGALINPIPAMGVALEIRPQLLLAKTAEERTKIALDGIWNSIQHMKGPRIQKIKE